jgi:hypothetical protein
VKTLHTLFVVATTVGLVGLGSPIRGQVYENDCSKMHTNIRFGLKADSIGETIWEFKANHSRARCSGDSSHDEEQKRLNRMETTYFGTQKSGFSEEQMCEADFPSNVEELGGVRYSVLYGFNRGHLDYIEGEFQQSGFETMREYFVTRYGPTLAEFGSAGRREPSGQRTIFWGTCENDPSYITLQLMAVTTHGGYSSELGQLEIMSKEKENAQNKSIIDRIRQRGDLPGCLNTVTNEVFAPVKTGADGVWGCALPLVKHNWPRDPPSQ